MIVEKFHGIGFFNFNEVYIFVKKKPYCRQSKTWRKILFMNNNFN